MFAIRNLARSAPRSAARFSTKAIRPQPTLLRSALVRSSWAPSMPRLTASFHISAALRRQESDVKDELVAKLDSEIAIEEDMKEDEDLSANIKEYIESSAYEIEDTPGNHEVFMNRTFGDETIRITFTTADLNSGSMGNEEFSEYDAEADDIAMAQSGGANTKGSVNQGSANDGNIRVAPEDRVAPADREELDDEYDEDAQQGFAAHVTIRIERPGKGALSIEATAQDGDFVIEDLGYYPASDLADPDTAEKDWQRRGLYSGPPFTNLDEDLQLLLERYLEERGINTRMALFIPDYIDHKEQKEYVRWLNNVKNFIA